MVYAGAERVTCRHEALRVGEVCPVCGLGRLYALPPGVEIRLDGYLTKDDRQKLLGIARRCPVAKALTSEIKIDEVLVS